MAIAQPLSTDFLNSPDHSVLHRIIAADTDATVKSIQVSTTQTIISAPADSTTAIQFNKADLTTNVLNIDTTNGRVGIGTTTPGTLLDVYGIIRSSSAQAQVRAIGDTWGALRVGEDRKSVV